jgi:hypothetical protein
MAMMVLNGAPSRLQEIGVAKPSSGIAACDRNSRIPIKQARMPHLATRPTPPRHPDFEPGSSLFFAVFVY